VSGKINVSVEFPLKAHFLDYAEAKAAAQLLWQIMGRPIFYVECHGCLVEGRFPFLFDVNPVQYKSDDWPTIEGQVCEGKWEATATPLISTPT
jgi:hypothetical protein